MDPSMDLGGLLFPYICLSLYMSNVPEVGFYSGFVRVIYVFLSLYFWVF